MDIKTIGVLGAGVMGNGIAQVASMAGYNVILRDIEDRFVEGGIKNIDKFLTKTVEKGKMSADDKAAIMGRIKGTTDMGAMKDADFIVEVVVEVMDIKKKVFAELDEITKPTSSSPRTRHPCHSRRWDCDEEADKVVGMHFFNPVPLMSSSRSSAGSRPVTQPSRPRSTSRESSGRSPSRSRSTSPFSSSTD
jgi:3-hydroxybutyryl-CoA dehydrogenase